MNDEFLRNMGIRISQQRRNLHLTQEQLAEQMGISLQSISCIELGKKAIRPENLANLCKSLNVSADYILYGKRAEHQMNEITEKLSKLSAEEYLIVQQLVDLLYKKNI